MNPTPPSKKDFKAALKQKLEVLKNPKIWALGFIGLLGLGLFLILGFYLTSTPTTEIIKRKSIEPKTAVTFTTQVPQAGFSQKKEAKSEKASGIVSTVGLGNVFKQDNKTEKDPDALETLYSESENEPQIQCVAPYGRLLCCETVLTIDSSNTLTPIIGLVTEDFWYDGKCLIPAGTEVHGSAQAAPMRDRVMTDSSWILVWVTQDGQNGQQLPLKALALDRDKNDIDNTWSILDGAAGIRGTLLKSDELAELKLFGATFLGGVIEGIQEPNAAQLTEDLDALGKPVKKIPKVKMTLKTATAHGTAAVIERYTQQILETLDKEAFFVRVPAGKQFYLYIQQPLDVNQIQSMK